jgi:hypothetical protein
MILGAHHVKTILYESIKVNYYPATLLIFGSI